jgi:hypothetical protein
LLEWDKENFKKMKIDKRKAGAGLEIIIRDVVSILVLYWPPSW